MSQHPRRVPRRPGRPGFTARIIPRRRRSRRSVPNNPRHAHLHRERANKYERARLVPPLPPLLLLLLHSAVPVCVYTCGLDKFLAAVQRTRTLSRPRSFPAAPFIPLYFSLSLLISRGTFFFFLLLVLPEVTLFFLLSLRFLILRRRTKSHTCFLQ